MRAVTGRYRKPDGREEVRTHFHTWTALDGTRYVDVSLHAHPCGHCVGGDHVHIEMHDARKPLEILAERDISFPRKLHAAIDDVLRAKSAADAFTTQFASVLG